MKNKKLPPTGLRQITYFPRHNTGDGTARNVSLKCESISIPGRNIDTTPDTNIYIQPERSQQGFLLQTLTATFQCSSDMREKIFFETWQQLSFNPNTWAMGYYK